MRILIVTQYFWPEDFRINDLAIGLREKGHEVTVLTGMPNYPSGKFKDGYGFFMPSEEMYEGIRVMRVPLLPRFSGKGWQLVLNYLSFVFFACLLAPFRVRGKYDVVFSYLTSPITAALPAILLSKMKKARLILWVQDLWPESVSATGAIQSKRILAMLGKLVTYIYNCADKILISSKSFESSVKHYTTNKNVDIEYFPNSVESLYQPVVKSEDFKARYKLPDGFIVMFAGNIGYAQDFPNILAAAERLRDYKDIHFVVLGEGRNYGWVLGQVASRGLSETVHLLGRHPMKLMPEFFAHADVLLATLKDEPVFSLTVPCKIQSYLACAKPILTAMAGEGGHLVVDSGAGLSVQPSNPAELADAILKMYSMNLHSLALFSDKAYRYYEEYFKRDMLLAKLEFYMTTQYAVKMAEH